MKKSKVKTILILLIIIVLCLSVGVYAGYTLSATEVSYTKSDGTTTVSVKEALDELRAGLPTKSIGDEVTVGGEQFYVLEWDNNSDVVTLMAKYNLNRAGTAQQDASTSVTGSKFSDTNYWSNETSYPLNLNDYIGFSSTDALGKTKSYGRSKGALSSRLLSYEEANALATKASSNTKIATMLWGRASSDNSCLIYWLGSASGSEMVHFVNGYHGQVSASDSWEGKYAYPYEGVRPVITILKSKIS